MTDRGSMMPLFGGAAVLLLVVVMGVVGSTSLLVERQRLFSLADGAAIYASESFDPEEVSRVNSRPRARLSSDLVERSTREFLDRVGPGPLESVRLESARTPDGWHAEVVLSSVWSPPVVSEFLPAALRIQVEARAQTFLR